MSEWMTILHFSGWLVTIFIYPDPKFKYSHFSWKICFFVAFFFFFFWYFQFFFLFHFHSWYFSLFNNLLSNFFVTWFFYLCYLSPHVSLPPEYVLKYIPLLVMKKILIFSCVCSLSSQLHVKFILSPNNKKEIHASNDSSQLLLHLR